MSEELPKSQNISTLCTYDTILNADSVEWCPFNEFADLFVCGTYKLQEDVIDGDKRIGTILLFSLSASNNLILHQTIKTAGILDMKWSQYQINSKSLLGVVTADKELHVYELNTESVQLKLLVKRKFESTVLDETLLLSLDWSTGKYSSDKPEIVCTDSNGNVHKIVLTNNELILEKSWHAHDYEAWITCFYYWNPKIFFTGGDDSGFVQFDTRLSNELIHTNKSHNSGVTSMHSNSKKEHLLATGSYDSYVRLWDIRIFSKPVNQIQMPGTLWRLKWDPFTHNHLIAACMSGGVHVIKVNGSSDVNVIESYYEQGNLAYGSDWCHLNKNNTNPEYNTIIATCSFYDHRLCVAELNLDF